MPHTSGNGIRKIVSAIQTAVGKLTGRSTGTARDDGSSGTSDPGTPPEDGSAPPSGSR